MQDLRRAGRLDPARTEDVLHAQRDARERARVASRLAGGVDRVGAAPRAVGVDQQVTAERAVEARDAIEVLLGDVARQPLARPHAVGDRHRGRAARVQRCAHEPPPSESAPDPGRIRGTWKKLPSRRGAFASASSGDSDGFTSSFAGRAVERHRVRHRLDRGRVERAQGIDILEDRAQIVGHRRDLLLGQAQARQQREFTDFVGGDSRHDRVAVHTTINRTDPVRVRLRARPEFATRHATRYSVGSEMTPSGNRFRALLVCLTPAVCLALALRRRRADAGRADAAGRVLRGAVRSFRGQPRSARDRLGARVPRRRRRTRDRRAGAGRSAGGRRARSRMRVARRRSHESRAGDPRQLRRSRGAGRRRGRPGRTGAPLDRDPDLPARLSRTSRASSAASSAKRRRSRSPACPSTSA